MTELKKPNKEEIVKLYQDPELSYLAAGVKSWSLEDFPEDAEGSFFCEDLSTQDGVRVAGTDREDMMSKVKSEFLDKGVDKSSLKIRQDLGFDYATSPSAARMPDGTIDTEDVFIGVYLNSSVDHTFPEYVEFKGYRVGVRFSVPNS